MSLSESDLSQASTKLDNEAPEVQPSKASLAKRRLKTIASNAQDVLLFLIAFRILNALSVGTFFQPDEFFQSLEPAWRIVFGRESGAWLTWEWKQQLRSAIHPTIFAAVYYACEQFARLARLSPAWTADLLVTAPKILQAILAALQDFFTWKLASRIFGPDSQTSWAALALTVASPWQWFCSTRSFSNGLETTLTTIALYNWPWHWLPLTSRDVPRDESGLKEDQRPIDDGSSEIFRLQRSLLLAGLACILRPTNILIWIPLAVATTFQRQDGGWLMPLPKLEQSMLVNFSYPAIRKDNQNEIIALIREVALCGLVVVLLSLGVDRLFYQIWAFPPIKFLLFNVIQSISIFYGQNDWHYYLSQGLPLLLTTALPFTLTAIIKAFFAQPSGSDSSAIERTTMQTMAIVCLVLPGVLSLISHKEVRFIYPLLPILHIITAPVLGSFFGPALSEKSPQHPTERPPSMTSRRLLLAILLFANAFISIYTTQIHGPGPLNVMSYLRNQYVSHYAPPHTTGSELLDPFTTTTPVMTVGFLMPCHSTPWRSHLVFPSIHAWALTCEPPLHLSPSEKETYLDEADQFYADPALWLRMNMTRHPPRPRGIFASNQRRGIAQPRIELSPRASSKREWPEYLVFFEHLEPTMDVLLRGSGYAECWRGWNTHWHDDSRRKGDIVAWCLYPERRVLEYHGHQYHGSSGKTLSIKSIRDSTDDAARKLLGTLEGPQAGLMDAANGVLEKVGLKKTKSWNTPGWLPKLGGRKASKSWIPSFSPSKPAKKSNTGGWFFGDQRSKKTTGKTAGKKDPWS